jgi:hypothetical protein
MLPGFVPPACCPKVPCEQGRAVGLKRTLVGPAKPKRRERSKILFQRDSGRRAESVGSSSVKLADGFRTARDRSAAAGSSDLCYCFNGLLCLVVRAARANSVVSLAPGFGQKCRDHRHPINTGNFRRLPSAVVGLAREGRGLRRFAENRKVIFGPAETMHRFHHRSLGRAGPLRQLPLRLPLAAATTAVIV